jgi:hypothetical protein
MSTSIEPAIAHAGDRELENLGLLHIAAERKHDRPSALRRRAGVAWQDTPDWRFHRQVMRTALYLRERARLGARDRVALVSDLRPELAVAAWGALTLGAPVAVLDPSRAPSRPELASQLAALGPRVVFADGETAAWIRSRLMPGIETVVAFDGEAREARDDGVVAWTEALDLGGSLDTAERANVFRAHARGLSPELPALGHAVGSNGSVAWRFLSHRDVVRRVQRVWARARIAKGDVAYLAADASSASAVVELLAFTSDGYSQVVLGNKGNDLEEIAMARPNKIVVSPGTVRSLMQSVATWEPSRVERILSRAPILGRHLRSERERTGVPSALGPARWISTGPTLDFAMRARVRRFVTLEIDDSLIDSRTDSPI